MYHEFLFSHLPVSIITEVSALCQKMKIIALPPIAISNII